MKSRSIRTIFALFGLAAAVLFTSCESTPKVTPKRFNYIITIDPALAAASVQVDLVGVNNSQIARYKNKSVDDYFRPGDALRQYKFKRTLDFGGGQATSQVIGSDDPIWAIWEHQNALQVVVIADLPGLNPGGAGNIDPRRLVLPLDINKWDKSGFPNKKSYDVQITITRGGVISNPGPLLAP